MPLREPPGPVLGRSRARVLEVLAAADAPLGVADLAERVGLHANTARFHLEALVSAGLAARSAEASGRAGRPRTVYRATEGSAVAGARSYRLLAEILAGHLAAHERRPADSAAEAGRVWGRHLARRPAPFARVTAGESVAQVLEALSAVGFEPDIVGTGVRRRILLNHCPFREVADAQREVVCSVHLGLVRGLLEEIGAPFSATGLDPLVAPSRCVVHLAAAPDRSNRTSDANRPPGG